MVMTKVEQLVQRVRTALPKVHADIDEPRGAAGTWWIDLSHGTHAVTVDWRPRRGFGVSSAGSEAYGERSDEVYADVDDAAARVVDLLRTGAKTAAPRDMVLQRIREERQITQADLAQLLWIS
jgi:hypothetical protein